MKMFDKMKSLKEADKIRVENEVEGQIIEVNKENKIVIDENSKILDE